MANLHHDVLIIFCESLVLRFRLNKRLKNELRAGSTSAWLRVFSASARKSFNR